MLSPGDTVADRYEVIKELAEGGMGALWLAHHVELDVDVALKVISGRPTPVLLERFKREAQAAAKLGGPHIVKVLDYGVHDGHPYLAMELLRGEDLDARIKREGRLSLDECGRVMRGVAKGVQLAHDAGIIHRDLKPANIFVEKVGGDENVRLLDFGIAKDLQAAGGRGSLTGASVVGSPEYMSPEQVWDGEVDARSDVWTMGVVAFEMLTGSNPFSDETLAKVYQRITRDPIPPVSSIRPELPPRFDEFFERALARDPCDRIASAREFATEFDELLEEHSSVRPGKPIATMAEPLPYATTQATKAPTESRRNVLWVVLSGVTVVAVLGAIIWRGRPAPPAPPAPSGSVAASGKPATTAAPSVDVVTKPTQSAPPPVGAAPPTSSSASPAPTRLRPPATADPAAPPVSSAFTPRSAPPPSAPPLPTIDPDFGIPLK